MSMSERFEHSTIRATYRVVTPMFLGAAEAEPELRPPSFKGVLRFWWRALAWGQLLTEAENDRLRAIADLQTREACLFGSRDSGQSLVSLTTRWLGEPPSERDILTNWPRNRPPIGSTYLGYGITESGKAGFPDHQPHRAGFPQAREFEVTCVLSQKVVDSQREQVRQDIERSLRIVGLVGGLGSRSRRAFGSLAIVQCNAASCTLSGVDEYTKAIRTAIPDSSRKAEFPPFTAFSRFSRVGFIGPQSDPLQLHEEMGEQYRVYRGQPSTLRGRTKIPFGLPLRGVDESNRRASPLLMHVHPVGEQFVGAVLFLPAEFHPNVSAGGNPEFYAVLSTWLDQLQGVPL